MYRKLYLSAVLELGLESLRKGDNLQMNILIIDIGTSSMRGILFNEGGQKLCSCQVKYQPEKRENGWIEQKASDWIRSLLEITRSISSQASDLNFSIDAVAVTSQRSSILPVDREGVPLMDTIMWQDQRNKEICGRLEQYNDLVAERSGAKVNTVFSGSRMAWIKEECPEIYKMVHKFVNIPEYVMHEMTGNYYTDYTYGSRSNLMNLREKRWDPELLKLFGIPERQLCTLLEPGSVTGRVTLSFAERSGLPEGIPVISAGGDQQCAAVGQGAYKQGNISIVAGTGGFLITTVDQAPEGFSKDMICNSSSVKGKYIIEANVLTCSAAFDWFCAGFYDWKDGKVNYDKINEELAKLDGKADDLIALPYFQGRSTPKWNPEAKAGFFNMTLASTRDRMLKALLESIFMEIKNNMNEFEKYTEIDRAYISGGMTNSSVLNQLQADVYGIPLCRLEDGESASLGALMISLCSLGVYSGLEEAFEAVRGKEKKEDFYPRKELYDRYEEKRQKMNGLYEKLYG